jgi:hypothetical protein
LKIGRISFSNARGFAGAPTTCFLEEAAQRVAARGHATNTVRTSSAVERMADGHFLARSRYTMPDVLFVFPAEASVTVGAMENPGIKTIGEGSRGSSEAKLVSVRK